VAASAIQSPLRRQPPPSRQDLLGLHVSVKGTVHCTVVIFAPKGTSQVDNFVQSYDFVQSYECIVFPCVHMSAVVVISQSKPFFMFAVIVHKVCCIFIDTRERKTGCGYTGFGFSNLTTLLWYIQAQAYAARKHTQVVSCLHVALRVATPSLLGWVPDLSPSTEFHLQRPGTGGKIVRVASLC
jgi:hypothetical protein